MCLVLVKCEGCGLVCIGELNMDEPVEYTLCNECGCEEITMQGYFSQCGDIEVTKDKEYCGGGIGIDRK